MSVIGIVHVACSFGTSGVWQICDIVWWWGFGCWTQRLRASMSAATEKITVCSILRSSISAYVSVGLPPDQGSRAKGFQFHAYFYMPFILDSVRCNGFELRSGNASKAKWNEFP